jgi:hypothetical protein
MNQSNISRLNITDMLLIFSYFGTLLLNILLITLPDLAYFIFLWPSILSSTKIPLKGKKLN